jgi:hypothetical protein
MATSMYGPGFLPTALVFGAQHVRLEVIQHKRALEGFGVIGRVAGPDAEIEVGFSLDAGGDEGVQATGPVASCAPVGHVVWLGLW